MRVFFTLLLKKGLLSLKRGHVFTKIFFSYLGRLLFQGFSFLWKKFSKLPSFLLNLNKLKYFRFSFCFSFFHDTCVAALSFLLSLFLVDINFSNHFSLTTLFFEDALFTLSTAGILFLYGMYGTPFRYPLSLQILEHSKITFLSCLFYAPLLFLTAPPGSFPNSFLFILTLVFFSGLVLSRLLYFACFKRESQFLHHGSLSELMTKEENSSSLSFRKKNLLLVGISPLLEPFLKVCSDENSSYKIIGLVTGKDPLKKREILGFPILGNIKDITSIITTLSKHSIQIDIVLVIDTSSHILRFLLKTLDAFKIPLKRLSSSVTKFTLSPKLLPQSFQSLTLEDLLEITHPSLDSETLQQFIRNERILITGGGGSLGRALVQKIALLKPQHLSFLDISEKNLSALEREILKHFPHLSCSYILGDICHKDSLLKIFELEAPSYVFHLAALKHVSLAETNPNQAAFTNILGTRNVIDISRLQKVKLVALASSFSCSSPQNILDVTKRIAEIYTQSADKTDGIKPQGTRFVVCRFDNFLGSSSSVISHFMEDLDQGGPLLLTRTEDMRIFIPLPDAVVLFLKACILGLSPSQATGHIYEARIGAPTKIIDIATYMCLMKGVTPYKEIEYKVIGPRKGEENFVQSPPSCEGHPTPYKGLYNLTTPLPDFSVVQHALDELEETTSNNRTHQTIRILHYLVPSYKRQDPTSSSKVS